MGKQGSTIIFDAATERSGAVVRIGLILLSSDEVGGDAFTSIMPKDDVLVFATRTAYDHSNGGFAVATSFPEVADTLPPVGRFDVLAFSCTSATIAMGESKLLSELEKARPGAKCTSPAIAAIAALKQLSARKIAILTPYSLDFHRSAIVPFFDNRGFDVVADGTFDKHTDAEMGELRQESIFHGAKTLVARSSPDALFVSCTATPIVPHIARLENELGIPVVTSTQAMAWDALRLAGYHRSVEGFGRLLASERR
ncbi:maleate cis-trans isomerase family protein [Bradyrhizobium manausense]|nr:hypothetical protein [Bradyrhizobium manausense]